MAFKKKSKKIEDTHNFGVPAADDEVKPSSQKAEVKAKIVISKDEMMNHAKFDKFKKGNS